MGLLFNGQEWLYLAALPVECMSLSFHKGDQNCLGYILALENKPLRIINVLIIKRPLTMLV